mmetsp:Transcript_30097/g.48040  ORF Transcript_30097/g.48040 Transcript_30097/m.48040 type:complete len:208 (-) Transcript_30097:69-692(-)
MLRINFAGIRVRRKPQSVIGKRFCNSHFLLCVQHLHRFIDIHCMSQGLHKSLDALSRFDTLPQNAVSVGIPLHVLHHDLTVILAETTFVLSDCSFFSFAGVHVLSADRQDTIAVHLKYNLNLRLTLGRWCNTSEVKLTEQAVILGQRLLTFVNLKTDLKLIVCGSGHYHSLPRWYYCVARNHWHHLCWATRKSESQSHRSHVEKQKV